MNRRKKLKATLLASLVALAAQQLSPAIQSAFAYTLDQTNRVITVSPTGNYTADVRNALAYLLNRSDKHNKWTFKFNPGKYYLTLPLYSVGLQNVDFVSDPNNPAQLIKAPNFSGNEYIIYTRMCKNINMSGFHFYGSTNFASNSDPVWTDQGVFFGSCDTVNVDRNKFYNFGNAAVRVTTSEYDPVTGVNSFNSRITNNYFNNVYQISTTSNSQVHGATANLRFENNEIVNLRAAVKFASRTAGAKNVQLVNNTINGSDHYGFEIDNYEDMEISGNTIQNIRNIAINIYTNPRAPKGFAWGDNMVISNNIIKGAERGIRFSPDPFSDGYHYSPKNVTIHNNTISALSTTNPGYSAISIVNGKIDGLKVTYNKFYSIANKSYIGTGSSTNVTLLGNQVEGVAYGPQPTSPSPEPQPSPSPTPVTSKPAAPSNLAGVLNGSKATLTWSDNATNEANYEVWASSDGGVHYALIAKPAANSTSYVHDMASNPKIMHYALRAMNSAGASGFVKAYSTMGTASEPAPAPAPEPQPAPQPVTSKPAAPSNLTGQYKGNGVMSLSWTDNANNEERFEIWVSGDGGLKYSLLAKIPANVTTYDHNMGSNPKAMYYALRAMNSAGASGFVKAYDITLASGN